MGNSDMCIVLVLTACGLCVANLKIPAESIESNHALRDRLKEYAPQNLRASKYRRFATAKHVRDCPHIAFKVDMSDSEANPVRKAFVSCFFLPPESIVEGLTTQVVVAS